MHLPSGYSHAEENITTPSSSSPPPTTAQTATTTTVQPPSTPPTLLGLLTVSWTGLCEGEVVVTPLSTTSSSSRVCHSSKSSVAAVLSNICQQRKGCKDHPQWSSSQGDNDGYIVTERGATKESRCQTLRVRCKVEVSSDFQGQLQAYKVVTALLCCVLLILLLIRFTRPTVKALQKRLSDRRQNRWIGPTQSHSVSYHRGKAAIRCNDEEKRLSYPALDRLTISNSRDPSSNRNSYNF
ncbi:unnamed protein product [Ophioblennius macclurei]